MGVDIASIGIAMDSRPVVEGTAALDRLAETSTRVEQKVGAMNGQMNDTAAIMRKNAEASGAASQATQQFLAPLQREIDLFGASRAETERYNAAKAGLAASAQRQAAALGAAIDALQRDERAAREFAAMQDQAARASDQFIKKLQDQVAIIGMNTAQLHAYRAAQLGVTDAAAPLIAKLAEAGGGAHTAGSHIDGLSFASVGARRELLVLAHELSQGNFQKFGGSMMVLGEQTGAAGLLFSATGLAALALVATLGGLAYAAIKGALDQKHMNDALVMTGNYAGLTSDSLNNLAHAAVAAGGSIGEAKKVATELAGSGKFTGDQIGYITEATVAWEHATGQSIKSIIKDFESLAVQTTGNTMRATEAISRATIKLDDQYHFLTESIYEQIRALEKEGDAKGASALATETFARATHDRAEEILGNLGSIARGWNGIKEAIGGAVDAVGNWGKKATPASEVARLTKALAAPDFLPGVYNRETRDDAVALATQQLAQAQKELNAADAAAAAQGKATLAQSEAVHAASRIAADDAKLQKKGVTELHIALSQYADDITKIKAVNPASALVTDGAVAAHVAAIKKAHAAQVKPDTVENTQVADHIARLEKAATAEKQHYAELGKLDDMYHKAGELSDQQYFSNKRSYSDKTAAAQIQAYDKEIAALRDHHTSTKAEAARHEKELHAIEDKREAAKAANSAESFRLDEAERLRKDAIVQGAVNGSLKEIASINAQVAAVEMQIRTYNMLPAAKTAVMIADLEEQAAALAGFDNSQKTIDLINQKIEALNRLRIAQGTASAQDQGTDVTKAKELLDILAAVDAATKSAASGMAESFGRVGSAIGGLTTALSGYAVQQQAIVAQLAAAKADPKNGPDKIAQAEIAAANASAQAKIKSYGDMAGAAKGFFKENTAGYKVMEGAEKAFRAYEMAMAMQAMVKKIFFKEGEVAANLALNGVKLTGEAATTAASTGLAATEASAWGITAVVKALASLPFPWNLAAGAATLAAVVAIGASMMGGISGGGADIAKDRQAAAGTGSVLGDSSAKSESISRSIALAATNSSIELTHTAGMLRALLNIQNSLSGLGNLLVRGGDVGGALPPDTMGTMSTWATKLDIGPLGGVLGKWTNKITNAIFGGNTTTIDGGLVANKTTVGGVMNGGLHASQYIDTKKDGGWFSSDKYRTQLTALGAEANGQFSMVISSMAKGITEAGKLLGLGGDAFTQRLNSFVVDIGKISTKGLTGEGIQKQLEAVFSKVGDDMARWTVGGLAPFQKVGEGYLETLVRVTANYANLDSVLQSIGMTFGTTGMASIAAREELLALAGGIDELAGKSSSFADAYLTQAERLAPVSKYVAEEMAKLGMASIDTRDEFKKQVLGLNLSTEAGRKQYVALMGLADAFAKTHAATIDLTKTQQEIADERAGLQKQLDQLTLTRAQLLERERSALDASNRGLWDQVHAAQKAKDAQDAAKTSLGDFISKMGSFASSTKALSASLLVGNLSTLTPEQQYAQLRRQYESTKAAALGGDTTAQGNFSQSMTAWLTASQKTNGGDSQYASDFAMGRRDAEMMSQWAAGQVDVAQASLNALNEQVSGISTLNQTMLQVAQNIDNLPDDLVATVAQAVLPVDYSRMGSSANTELLAEVKALRISNESLATEVKGLRAEQRTQTGDIITSNAAVTVRAAETVVDGLDDANTNARSSDYKVSLNEF